jgi:hypothetical protein
MRKKGLKYEGNYATVGSEGMNYESIAVEMKKLGYPMNHSTARNVFNGALRKIICKLEKDLELDLSSKKLEKSKMFQEAIRDFLDEDTSI